MMTFKLLLPLTWRQSVRCFSRLPVIRNARVPKPDEETLGPDPLSLEIKFLWSMRDQFDGGDGDSSALISDRRFRETCLQVMKGLRYLRPNETRSLAHLVFGLNLPVNLGISRGVLQMLRVHINEFDADQLADLYLLLRKVHGTNDQTNPVLEALLIGIPKAMEIAVLRKKMDASSYDSLLLILRSGCLAAIDGQPLNFLIRLIIYKILFMDGSQVIKFIGLLCHPHIESNLDQIGRSLIQKSLDSSVKKILYLAAIQQFEKDYNYEETIKALEATKDPIYSVKKIIVKSIN